MHHLFPLKFSPNIPPSARQLICKSARCRLLSTISAQRCNARQHARNIKRQRTLQSLLKSSQEDMHAQKNIIVIGLGKTGFSCVRFLVERGFNVAVIDSREQPPFLEKLRAKYPHVPVSPGSFTSPLLDTADTLIISPGIALHEEAFAPHLARGVNIIGDIELFAETINTSSHTPIIAITGSNGKSTVTTLVAAMAEQAGLRVKVGGNLGTPALDLLDSAAELYVLELSSFQLETTHSLRARAATVLNVTPDHMDRYQNFAKYCAAKWRVYDGCDVAIINRDDPESYRDARLPAHIVSFGLTSPTDKESFGFDGDHLLFSDKNNRLEKLLHTNELKIRGLHQIANALAALALGYTINLPLTAMINTLRTFAGLEHRCQWVRKISGIDFYNDSKGTNIGSTKAAIEGLGKELERNTGENKLILIAGGLGKGADFTELRAPIARHVKTTILLGKDAPLIATALQGCCKIVHASSMHDAVAEAFHAATAGDAVLLSPACASFDMFDDFEHRGKVFMEEVKKL